MTAPLANNLSWANNPKYWELDFGVWTRKSRLRLLLPEPPHLRKESKTPPVLILRPTRFKTNLGMESDGDKIIARGQSLVMLLRSAYDEPAGQGFGSRILLPSNFPGGKFDLMLTLPTGPDQQPREALQAEIKKQFGIVARVETIETNVLSLKVENTAGPALQETNGRHPFVSHPKPAK